MPIEITSGMAALGVLFTIIVVIVAYFAGRQTRSEREEERIKEAIADYQKKSNKANNETIERLQEEHDSEIERIETYYMQELEKFALEVMGITFKPEDIEDGRFTKMKEIPFPKVADNIGKIVVIKPVDSSEDEYDEIPMLVRKERDIPGIFDLNGGVILSAEEEVPAIPA